MQLCKNHRHLHVGKATATQYVGEPRNFIPLWTREEIHLLFPQATPRPQRKRLACEFVIFVIWINPTVRYKIIRLVEISGIVCDSPGASVALRLRISVIIFLNIYIEFHLDSVTYSFRYAVAVYHCPW